MLGNLDKYQIILASNSPRRKELMSGLGVDYVVRTLPEYYATGGTVDYGRYDCLARW